MNTQHNFDQKYASHVRMGLFQVLAYGYIVLFLAALSIFILNRLGRITIPPAVLEFRRTWGTLLFWGALSAGLIVLLGALLEKQPTCSTGIGSRRMCEGFQDTKGPYGDLLERVQAAIGRIQEDITTLSDIGDQTCALVNEVEEAYAGASAGNVPESEFSLPRDVQESRRQERLARAHQQFKRQRALFHQVRSQAPMLECFQNSTDDNTEEKELQAAVLELQTLLENEQVVASIQATEQIGIALQFTNKYLDKGLPAETGEGFQASDPGGAAVAVGSLWGPALIRYTTQLLNREAVFHSQVLKLADVATSTRSRVDAQYNRAARLESGNIQIADVKAGLQAPK